MTFKALPFVLFAAGVAMVPVGSAVADDNAPAYTIEDVTACSPDAMRLCKDKLPDLNAIEACMKAHYDDLRPKCKARFTR